MVQVRPREPTNTRRSTSHNPLEMPRPFRQSLWLLIKRARAQLRTRIKSLAGLRFSHASIPPVGPQAGRGCGESQDDNSHFSLIQKGESVTITSDDVIAVHYEFGKQHDIGRASSAEITIYGSRQSDVTPVLALQAQQDFAARVEAFHTDPVDQMQVRVPWIPRGHLNIAIQMSSQRRGRFHQQRT
jgi:hypothetical protein